MENQVLLAIANRRSIRAYQPDQITDAQLNAILQAAQASPSATNAQPWHFTAVQNPDLLARINEATRQHFLDHATDAMRARFVGREYSVFYHAPTVIFISCPPLEEKKYAQTDCGMAAQTMALAAHSLGLGSVILGMPRVAFDGPQGDEFRTLLQFPEGYDFILALAVGLPATTKEAHPILPNLVKVVR